MATGKLQVRVTAVNGTIMVANANVAINNALGFLSHNLTTDQNGLTAEVELFAPVRELSISPFAPRAAYSLYEVIVSHPQYNTQIVRGVQVFSGATGLLPIDLSPRATSGEATLLDIVDIPPSAVSASQS